MTATILRETDPFWPDQTLIPIVAAGFPVEPPAEWFTPPDMLRPTPLTVLASGQVYGHIAPWKGRHTGNQSIRPPRNRSGYAYFKTGQVLTAGGAMQPVGQITLVGGHAPLTASHDAAVAHYDNTQSAVADVNIGEDRHGIWVAGALRPGVTPEQVRAIRASAVSGDWRPINGRHELIAICHVNHPGFPVIPQCEALVASGEMQAIVAAGAQDMFAYRMLDTFLPDDEALTAAIDARVSDALLRERLRARMRR
jgi:hypothetical protein